MQVLRAKIARSAQETRDSERPQYFSAQGTPSSKCAAGTGGLPLSHAGKERLEQLRMKAAMAEAREEVPQRVSRQPPVVMVSHLVQKTDDLTDLAVRYGTTISQIRSLNPRVFEQGLDNVMNEVITIPATRSIPTKEDPAVAARLAEHAEINRRAKAMDEFLQITQCPRVEAQFYLDEVEYDLQKALQAYQADVDWESDQKKNSGRSKQMPVMPGKH